MVPPPLGVKRIDPRPRLPDEYTFETTSVFDAVRFADTSVVWPVVGKPGAPPVDVTNPDTIALENTFVVVSAFET
jgi:hypothetical protein